MSSSPRKAHAKVVGEDVEDLVADTVDDLDLVDEADAHHDAVTTGLLTPTPALPFGSVCLLEAGTRVEIKTCCLETSNGDRPTPGRWFFKGRRDGQHAALLEDRGAYLLTVYRDPDQAGDQEREVVRMLLLPASIVDELLDGSWYDSGRTEGEVAKLAWTALLDGGDSA